jgi:hypothetical protein
LRPCQECYVRRAHYELAVERRRLAIVFDELAVVM